MTIGGHCGTAGQGDRDAHNGLALLRLMAEAADRKTPGWVNRRVEQLEFLDTRAVRWRVSVDFAVPAGAPVIRTGQKVFRLVPLTSWIKDNLVAFDLRDESGNTLWLPTAKDTERMLTEALIRWAGQLMDQTELPDPLKETLRAMVSERPPQRQKDHEAKTGEMLDPFEAVVDHMVQDKGRASDDYASKAPAELADNRSFQSQINELWRNDVIVVPVADPPGTRRVLKMTFESGVQFRKAKTRRMRAVQLLGWRAWRMELYIGGRGGSHHLEVAAPPGVDILRIRARSVTTHPDPTANIVVFGGSPHVHLRIGADRHSRYLATIRVRVSRPGWLTTSWLAGLVILVVLLVGGLKLKALFSAVPEAGTAASLLLALLALFATMLTGPGAHPLASRLLTASRFLILVDSILILLGAGSLLLLGGQPTGRWWPLVTALWWLVVAVSGICAAMLTLSRFFPKAPREVEEKRWERLRTALKVTWNWLIGNTEEPGKPDRASLSIPAADGYHYGDDPDNHWDPDSQTALVNALRSAE
jgi:hypothetical protein